MKNGNISDFIEGIHYGKEILFLYHDKQFFIQGWWDNNIAHLVLDCIDSDVPDSEGYIWEHSAPTMSECADAFLEATLWDGKTFLNVEEEMTWAD